MADAKRSRRQWRDYRTRAGRRPVKDFLDGLSDEEVAAIVAGMKDVAERGPPAARHLRGEIYEVRADAMTRSFRVLFATEGRYSQVLLSLVLRPLISMGRSTTTRMNHPDADERHYDRFASTPRSSWGRSEPVVFTASGY